MAPLPSSNTARLYLDYTVGGEDHTQTVRYDGPGNRVPAAGVLAELWAFLSSELYGTTIQGLRFSIAGSDVTNPMAWPGDPTYGAGSPPAGQQMKFFSIVGKSADGRRVRMEQFGITQAIPSTWRLARGINAAMDDWYDHVQIAHGDFVLCTISELPAIFNLYYNFKYADNDIAKVRA